MGSRSSFAFKDTGTKQHVFPSTKNGHLQHAIINDLYFELKLHRHNLGTPETYIGFVKRGIIGPL